MQSVVLGMYLHRGWRARATRKTARNDVLRTQRMAHIRMHLVIHTRHAHYAHKYAMNRRFCYSMSYNYTVLNCLSKVLQFRTVNDYPGLATIAANTNASNSPNQAPNTHQLLVTSFIARYDAACLRQCPSHLSIPFTPARN